MSLEDYGAVESSEGGSNSAEISEKYKQAAKKARSAIKRTKKDEKKAKKYDFLLAKFLVEMILKRKYDNLLDNLFSCFDLGYGTNFLLGILSLVYLPISHEIRKFSGKQEIEFHYTIPINVQNFDDHDLPIPVRERVNAWIDDMEAVMGMEASSIITKRNLHLIVYDEKVREFTTQVFSFFFSELNISITDSKARNYSDFILGELEKKTKNIFEDMLSDENWEQGEI